jgi:hypothetical protein
MILLSIGNVAGNSVIVSRIVALICYESHCDLLLEERLRCPGLPVFYKRNQELFGDFWR